MTTALDCERIATLLEREARIKIELAQEFRARSKDGPEATSIQPPYLGTLQQAVFDILRTADESGFSPREIAKQLDRGDEPNIRSALDRMRDRGVTELVAGFVTQRWQLTAAYRRS